MYKSDFDLDGLALDALQAILNRRMFDYTQLKKKIECLKKWKNMNSYEIGGAFKYKNSAKVHYRQSQEEMAKIMEEFEQ